MEVTIGYWAIPAAITLVSMTWAIVWGNREMGSSSGYGSWGEVMAGDAPAFSAETREALERAAEILKP